MRFRADGYDRYGRYGRYDRYDRYPTACSDSCDFELTPVPAVARGGADSEWFVLRSRSTGRYVRLHHAEMPEDPSWEGIQHPHARAAPHRPRNRFGDGLTPDALKAAAEARGTCPLRSGVAGYGFHYNVTLWEPVIQHYLEPWLGGNLSATVFDLAYWKTIYGWSRRNALPGVHVSVQQGRVHVKEQIDYRLELFRDVRNARNARNARNVRNVRK